MTTPFAASLYLAEHLAQWQGKGYACYNPHNKPLEELPVIYGFNNGGPTVWLHACAIAEDGRVLANHVCSGEGYMRHDLGIFEGARGDLHDKAYKTHYPDGYRMDFVSYDDVDGHAGLKKAFELNKLMEEQQS